MTDARKRRQHYLEDHHPLEFASAQNIPRTFKEELEPVKEEANAELRCSFKEPEQPGEGKRTNFAANLPPFLSEKRKQAELSSIHPLLDRTMTTGSAPKTSSQYSLNKTLTEVKELKIKSKELIRIANNYSHSKPKQADSPPKQVE